MDTPPVQGTWQRLGRALTQRRGHLGYAYRQRERFLRDRGSTLSSKTIARLERGDRDDYTPATLAAVETLYGLQPGAIEAFLAGAQDLATVTTRVRVPGSRNPPGAELTGHIVERLLRRGSELHDAVEFAASLGLPQRGELGIVQWQRVATELGESLGRVLVDFGVVDPGDLILTSPPPRPPVQAVPSEARKRA